MDPTTYTDPQLTLQDRLVIEALVKDPAQGKFDIPWHDIPSFSQRNNSHQNRLTINKVERCRPVAKAV